MNEVDGIFPCSYNQMRAFQKRTSQDFLLTASQQPEIRVQLSGLRQSAGDGSFQAFGARILPKDRAKLVAGIANSIQPVNISGTYRWTVAPGVTISPLKASP